MDSQQYWTWDKARNDYYHADFDRNTSAWKYTWAKDQVTPRALPRNTSIPQAQPAQAFGNYVHTPAPHSGLEHTTQGMTRLNIDQHQGQQGQRVQPANVGAVADTSRPAEQLYRTTTYRTPNLTSASTSYYEQSPPAASTVADQASLTAAGGRPVQGMLPVRWNGTLYPASNVQPQNQTWTRNNGAAVAQGPHNSRAPHSGEQRARDPSSVARTPPAFNTLYNSNGTLQPAANGLKHSSGRDNLDPTLYKQIKFKTHKFFVVGKVFMMLYIENSGPNPDLFEGSHFTTVAHGEVAYHQFRRFVVVQEMSKQQFCYCCPITTYGSRATTKPGVDQSAHAIVFTGKTPPEKLEGEKDMTKDPIRIVPVSPDEKLDPMSRINLGKVQLVQHNWKIREIGDVHEKSLPKLLHYRKAVRDS